tara:strand:+ start:795 stop:1829 length:1035 start_codon:yes stop_codon:yes gene_type:complete
MTINVSVFGASGYTGNQLLKILEKHPNVNLVSVHGNNSSGKKLKEICSGLKKFSTKTIKSFDQFKEQLCDILFLCLPHKKSQDLVNIYSKVKIIDLSADFRINDVTAYKEWYETDHACPQMLDKFIYGLSEIYRENIKKARLVSNPGCYPTSILIPLIPILKEKFLKINNIIIDSKSGISGAGKSTVEEYLSSEMSENFRPYNIEKHRHLGEISQELNLYDEHLKLTFVPHLLPIARGICSTIYVDVYEKKVDVEDLKNLVKDFFNGEHFVKILSGNEIPSLKNVRYTNNIAFNFFHDYYNQKIIIISCIDNLIKGASGQAIQNMNIMFELEETNGLTFSKLNS